MVWWAGLPMEFVGPERPQAVSANFRRMLVANDGNALTHFSMELRDMADLLFMTTFPV